MKSVEWETSRIHELDLASTELSGDCLMDILCRMPGFTYLGLGYCEFFTDKVASLYEPFFYARRIYASAVLGVVILSVCQPHACFATKPNNAPRIF